MGMIPLRERCRRLSPLLITRRTSTTSTILCSGSKPPARTSMALLPTPSFSNHLYGASITVRDNARCRGRHCFTTRLYYHADGTVTATTAQTPINLSNASDQVILVLYGTGIRNRSSLAAANVKVGGRTLPALYAGSQPQYPDRKSVV